MRRRFGFIKNFFRAVVWLIALVCCFEVGLRIALLRSDSPAVESMEIPLRPSALVYRELEPLGSLDIRHPDREETISVHLNSLGTRGPEPDVLRPPHVLRVVCLGDETTFGPGLRDEELFTTHLQTHLDRWLNRPVEVINAGLPGACPLLSLLQYRHRLMALQPDVIVITFDMSDVADDHACRPFARLDARGIPLACRHPAVDADSPSKAIEENFVTLHRLKQELKGWKSAEKIGGIDDIHHAASRYAWIRENPPDWSTYVAHALEPVLQMRQMTADEAPLLLLAVCPAPWQVSGDATPNAEVRKNLGISVGMRFASRQPFDQLARFAEQNHLNYLDLSLAFAPVGNPEGLYFENAPWLSDRGHELVAGVLANWLIPRLRYDAPASEPAQIPITPASLIRKTPPNIY